MKRIYSILLAAAILLTGVAVKADDLLELEPFTETFSDSEARLSEPPVIDAGAAIVIEKKTGRVLFEKNARSQRPIASTTKIITAIVALENGSLGDSVTVSKNATSIWGSKVNIKAGNSYPLEELLYGLLLHSGNDAAIAIAEHIGGSVEGFAQMMNNKAREIGAKNSSFKTPHGLDSPGHYSTAYDLALITSYALDNPVFARIVSTKSAAVLGRSLNNTNEMLNSYPGADGVKTGYTGKAGRCLVTSATRDGMQLISVVLNCASRTKRAQNSARVLDYSFDNYKTHILVQKDELVAQLPVKKGKGSTVSIRSTEAVEYPLTSDELEMVEKKVYLPAHLRAPVVKGMEAGSVEFFLNGSLLAYSTLKCEEGVSEKGFFDYLADIFKAWGGIMRAGLFHTI